jgi:UDP-glucose 4-epimerase
VNTTILITGGAGYIGSQVVKGLNERGYRTITYDNLVNGHRESVKWGEFVKGDVGDTERLRQVFSAYDVGAVMHFAAYIEAPESVRDPRKHYHNNTINTLKLLDVMLNHQVLRFIYSSSCAVYGEPKEIPITENHPFGPINPYGQSKLMVEKVLADYDRAYGLKYISFRYFNAAGADPDAGLGENHKPETHLIPLVFEAALGKSKSTCIYGEDYNTPDGTCIRDYIHVIDLAQAHILGLEKLLGGSVSDVFNLGNGQGYSVKEVIRTVKEITGVDFPTIIAPRRDGDVSCLVGSSQKAREILGWMPRHPGLKTIVQSVWDWYNKRGIRHN